MVSPATTDEPTIECEQRKGIAFITLNRPRQYNALSLAMLDALNLEMDRLQDDADVRVVVIAAHGKAFCAGHDLREMNAANDSDFVHRLFDRCSAMMQKISGLRVPVIAEIHGMATAAGCQLVAQCDLAVASDRATFAVSGVSLGLFCFTPAVPLSRAISRKRALEMLMTGKFIDAATALEWGLVNRVVPPHSLRAETLTLARTLIANPKESLAAGKAQFYQQLELGVTPAYQIASAEISRSFMLAEAQKGISAFLDKRKPVWD